MNFVIVIRLRQYDAISSIYLDTFISRDSKCDFIKFATSSD